MKYTWKTFLREAVMVAVTALFALPFYLIISNSLKSTTETYTNPFGLPSRIDFSAFSEILSGAGQNANFVDGLFNSLAITAGSLVLLIAFGALAAYCLARHSNKISNLLYLLFMVGIIVPSQLGILPIYMALKEIHLTGNILGCIILYACKQMPFTIFLYTGFFKALPIGYEEAAAVDGATWGKAFWRIILPQMNIITGTAVLMNTLYIWNDTFDQMVFLSGSKASTLPVLIYNLTIAITARWDLVFAAVIISLLPMIILYLFTQKAMMTSMSGGLKG